MEALAVSWTAREKTIQSHISGLPECIPDRKNDVPLPGTRMFYETCNKPINVLRGKLQHFETQAFIYLLVLKAK